VPIAPGAPKTWCTTPFVALLRERISFDPAQGSVFGYLCGVLRHRVSRHFRQQEALGRTRYE
jgi:hypothetical protein